MGMTEIMTAAWGGLQVVLSGVEVVLVLVALRLQKHLKLK